MSRKMIDIGKRSRQLADGRCGAGPVVYWMSRDQRVQDNWALLLAQNEALARKKPLVVVFCLTADYPGAELRSYHFLLNGLEELQQRLAGINIPFAVLIGDPPDSLPTWLISIDAHLLVGDFDPLRIKRQWQQRLLSAVTIPFIEVDTHNVIPAWIVSPKKEYSAATFRPKYRRLIDDYLTGIPKPIRHPQPTQKFSPIDISRLLARVGGKGTLPIERLKPGEKAAGRAMKQALNQRLPGYAQRSGNPCLDGRSGLSPYLHFGQLSAQRVAWEVHRSSLPEEDREAFLEELLVRRELADNFCLYEPHYDQYDGFPAWARATLDNHRSDRRIYRYKFDELNSGRTHEKLWNACQLDLVHTGRLHGYLRMYWAKKILEWSAAPEEALETAILFNDRYSLDGRDPNGYAGIAWSIGGVHDRAWPERPVYGKIRYMNEAGCRRKFPVDDYIRNVHSNIR